MSLFIAIRSAGELIKKIVRKNKRKIILLLCFFVITVLVGIVGAIIYNWMYVTGNARIGTSFIPIFRCAIII
jgi:hypothetical protein